MNSKKIIALSLFVALVLTLTVFVGDFNTQNNSQIALTNILVSSF